MPEKTSLFEFREYCAETYYPRFTKPTTVGNPLAVHQSLGPIAFEEFRTDQEPSLPSATQVPFISTIQIWKASTQIKAPRGWFRLAASNYPPYIGYFNALTPAYTQRWKKSARNLRDQWLRGKARDYDLAVVPLQEFSAACRVSTLPKKAAEAELARLAYRQSKNPNTTIFFVARRKADGKIGAGLAVVDIPHAGVSFYSSSFFLEEMREDNLVTALIDHWFSRSVEKNYTTLHFGLFQPPAKQGADRWSSISRFKSQFVDGYKLYEYTYVRCIPGRLVFWLRTSGKDR